MGLRVLTVHVSYVLVEFPSWGADIAQFRGNTDERSTNASDGRASPHDPGSFVASFWRSVIVFTLVLLVVIEPLLKKVTHEAVTPGRFVVVLVHRFHVLIIEETEELIELNIGWVIVSECFQGCNAQVDRFNDLADSATTDL